MRFLGVTMAALLVSSCSCTRTPSRGAAEGGAGAGAAPPTIERGEIATATPETRRDELVASLERAGFARSPRVLDALRRVPRHLFVPEAALEDAYDDRPLPIGSGQTISQPAVVAEMTEALDPKPDEHVLEIGTGSGYQAAVLAVLAREVFSIEIVPELGERAKRRLGELGYANVHVRIGDGYNGWPEHAPFPRIILTAAPPEIPRALLDQLAEGGILVAPEGEEGAPQWLVRVRKTGGKITRERLEPVRFVPMVRGRLTPHGDGK
jgi:protein-L-isoaspartate(D-aspartate) O-methyltransferase